MTGTEVLVDGERRRVVGTVSMDAIAVELPGELAVGTPVTLVGDGLLAGGARAGRRHDQLRARVRDRQRGPLHAHGGRSLDA